MVQIENINYLKKHFRGVRELTKDLNKNNNIKVINSKTEVPTLTVTSDGRTVYLHSKYNPIQEAEQLVEQYSEELNKKENVFFYGIGLGYHVEVIAKRFPHLSITLYEPNVDVFHCLLDTRLIKDLGGNCIKHVFVETSEYKRNQFLREFASKVHNDVVLITLPSYERVFEQDYQNFAEMFANEVKNKRSNLRTDFAFERRWTLNSLINLKEVIKTPNILHNENKSIFKAKPAIIVAAGPSLTEELDHLRYIKENGLAYIFSVGSAINTLVEYGVYPDAACTYDPQAHNHVVFEKAINQQVDLNIPLIYGTSVGFETLEKYRGPKAYMLTSQDTVSPYFLQSKDKLNSDKVSDAPSIAVVTTELLNKLECDPIIFVGQNFAYLNNTSYAKGIEYEGRSNEIPKEVLEKALTIESVNGESIITNEGFNKMKIQMEKVIQTCNEIRGVTFINTTQGGAKIEGTNFQSLQEVIKHELSKSDVVKNWYEQLYEPREFTEIKNQKSKMEGSLHEVSELYDQLWKKLKQIDQLTQPSDQLLNPLLNQFDKYFKKLTNSDFFKVFILPMARIQHEMIVKQMREFRFEQDTVSKKEKILHAFTIYFRHIKHEIELIVPIYHKVMAEIEPNIDGDNIEKS